MTHALTIALASYDDMSETTVIDLIEPSAGAKLGTLTIAYESPGTNYKLRIEPAVWITLPLANDMHLISIVTRAIHCAFDDDCDTYADALAKPITVLIA